MQPIIGVDVGGADLPEEHLISFCKDLEQDFGLKVYSSTPVANITLCSEVITMDDDPLRAARQKKDSTLVRAIADLRAEEIDALLTCGHTGAVTAASVLYLKTFEHLHHPGLVALLPHRVAILDVGAFITATTLDLFNYVCLGNSFGRIVLGIECPKIGLLNIGRESGRGTQELRELDRWLKSYTSARWQYCGNVEPASIFSHAVDVVVTNGFTGNIFLKTAEGMARGSLATFIDSQSEGALLAGVRGAVIKSHGASSKEGFVQAIHQAAAYARNGVCKRLESEYASYSQERESFSSI